MPVLQHLSYSTYLRLGQILLDATLHPVLLPEGRLPAPPGFGKGKFKRGPENKRDYVDMAMKICCVSVDSCAKMFGCSRLYSRTSGLGILTLVYGI